MNQSVDANQAEWQGTLAHCQEKSATQKHFPKITLSINESVTTQYYQCH